MTPPTATATEKHPPNFDTAKLRDGLTGAGIVEKAAGAIVTAIIESQFHLATKADLKQLESSLKHFVLAQTVIILLSIIGIAATAVFKLSS